MRIVCISGDLPPIISNTRLKRKSDCCFTNIKPDYLSNRFTQVIDHICDAEVIDISILLYVLVTPIKYN